MINSTETGFRAPLSAERIAQVALEIIDELGDTGLTMRRLGERLGVDPMAVYHHLPNRQAIVDRALEAMFTEVAVPPEETSPLDVLRFLAVEFRRVMLAHPNATALLPGQPIASSRPLIGAIDATFTALFDLGLPPEQVFLTYSALVAWVMGATQAELTARPLPEITGESAQQLFELYRDAASTRRVAPYLQTATGDQIFAAGLDLVVSGIADLAEESREQSDDAA